MMPYKVAMGSVVANRDMGEVELSSGCGTRVAYQKYEIASEVS